MNNQLTPETDKACDEVYAQGVAHIPLVAFMEKLERERDEALNEGLEQARLLGMSGEREAKLIAERDEALRLLGKWEQVAIGAGERVLELTRQREKLAEAAKLIADEYEDRCSQFGGDPLWVKHEQGSAIENALAIIHEHHYE